MQCFLRLGANRKMLSTTRVRPHAEPAATCAYTTYGGRTRHEAKRVGETIRAVNTRCNYVDHTNKRLVQETEDLKRLQEQTLRRSLVLLEDRARENERKIERVERVKALRGANEATRTAQAARVRASVGGVRRRNRAMADEVKADSADNLEDLAIRRGQFRDSVRLSRLHNALDATELKASWADKVSSTVRATRERCLREMDSLNDLRREREARLGELRAQEHARIARLQDLRAARDAEKARVSRHQYHQQGRLFFVDGHCDEYNRQITSNRALLDQERARRAKLGGDTYTPSYKRTAAFYLQ